MRSERTLRGELSRARNEEESGLLGVMISDDAKTRQKAVNPTIDITDNTRCTTAKGLFHRWLSE